MSEDAKFTDLFNPMLPRLSRAQKAERLNICRKCEHYTKFERCSLCGCVMPLKVALAHATCPIDKWGPNGLQNNIEG
jgi:rRNA maturation protein Nop10